MAEPSEKRQITILDGGTGMTLKEMGHQFLDDDPLWSAAVVSSHPEDIVKLHTDFFTAGADVVVTATYQASVEGFVKRFWVKEEEAVALIKRGVTLAQQAQEEAEKLTGRHGYVAASIGPYGAVLHDYSEYNGKYADSMTREELSFWHVPRMKAVVEAKPDILAIETIPALKEAEAILDTLTHFSDCKAYVTFQCQNGSRTGHGEDISHAIQTILSHPVSERLVAVGVNCIHPKYVTPLLTHIWPLHLTVPVIVKPNGGRFESREKNNHTNIHLADFVEEWTNHGASWLGGCCHIFPQDIRDLRAAVDSLPRLRTLQNGEALF